MKKDLDFDQKEAIGDSIKRELAEGNEEWNVSVNIGQKKTNSPPFFMVFQATSLMVNKCINPSALKVFWHLCCKLGYSNHVGIDQKTVAEDINMPLRTVKSAFLELLETNMVISYPDPQDNRRNIYIINPNLVWKGKEKSRKSKVKDLAQYKLFENSLPNKI